MINSLYGNTCRDLHAKAKEALCARTYPAPCALLGYHMLAREPHASRFDLTEVWLRGDTVMAALMKAEDTAGNQLTEQGILNRAATILAKRKCEAMKQSVGHSLQADALEAAIKELRK